MFDIFFRRKTQPENGKLPAGQIEVTRNADDSILLQFIGTNGHFHWFKFTNDDHVRKLAQQLEAVATRAVDQA